MPKRAAPVNSLTLNAAVNRGAFRPELGVNFGGDVTVAQNAFRCEPCVNFGAADGKSVSLFAPFVAERRSGTPGRARGDKGLDACPYPPVTSAISVFARGPSQSMPPITRQISLPSLS